MTVDKLPTDEQILTLAECYFDVQNAYDDIGRKQFVVFVRDVLKCYGQPPMPADEVDLLIAAADYIGGDCESIHSDQADAAAQLLRRIAGARRRIEGE